MDLLFGAVIGILFSMMAGAFVWFIYTLMDVQKQLVAAQRSIEELGVVLGQTAESAALAKEQLQAVRRMISAMETMTGAVNQFNALVLASPDSGTNGPPTLPPSIPPQDWTPSPRRRGPLPANPAYEQPAPEGESDVLSQDDATVARIQEFQEMRDRGIEVMEDAQLPPLSQMKTVEE